MAENKPSDENNGQSKDKALIPYQSNLPAIPELPRRNLRQVLDYIDKNMPEDLEIWGNDPSGTRTARKKEFNANEVEASINEVVKIVGRDEEDQERLRIQFANIYEQSFHKLYIPTEDDPNRWRYDEVPAGLVDRFLVKFPQELQKAVEGKTEAREISGTILEITNTGLNKIHQTTEEERPDLGEWQISFLNSHLPFDTSDVTVAALQLTSYVRGGLDSDTKAKLDFITEVKKHGNDERFNSHDLKTFSERGIFIKAAEDILQEHVDTLPVLNNYVLRLVEERPQLFVDISKETMIAIARTAQDVALHTGVNPTDAIKMIEEQTIDIGGKDNMGSIMFVKYGLPALARATRSKGYTLEQAKAFSQLTADYFHTANGNRKLEEGYLDMRGFVEDGLIAQLLEIPVDGFAQEVIHDAYDSDKEKAALAISNTRNALNMIIAYQTISNMTGNPVSPQVIVDFYHEVIKTEKLPWGLIGLRKNLNAEKAGIHPNNSGKDHFLAVLKQIPNYDYSHENVINLGLDVGSKSKYLSALTLEQGLEQDPETFAYYIEGLGILDNSLRHSIGKKEFVEFMPQPDNPEGKKALVIAVANLAKIYRQTTTETQRDRMDELFKYILKSDQLRVPFFTHLYYGGNSETMQSLSWVTRLASTDQNSANGETTSIGLQEKVNDFLSEVLLDSQFTLPEPKDELKPELQDPTTKRNDTAITLVKRVDTSMPLGRAISVIATADNSLETAQQIADALGKVELHSIEDAKTLSGPIIASFIKYLDLDPEVLRERMFTFKSGEEIVDEISEQSPVAGMIAGISSLFGGGPLPTLAYAPESNNIIITEKHFGGYQADGLGEEVMHWVRDTVTNGEHNNPVVQEFWGFVGRRIARAALKTTDTHVEPNNFEEAITDAAEHILRVERPGTSMIDIGYRSQLKNIFLHSIGYVAGSNVDLDKLPKALIRESDDLLIDNFVREYGPKQEWFEKVINQMRTLHEEKTKEWNLSISFEEFVQPIKDILDQLPYIDQKNLGL